MMKTARFLRLFTALAATVDAANPTRGCRVWKSAAVPHAVLPRMTMDPDEAFSLLGLPRGASMAEVRRKFRLKAREVHPDVNDKPDAALEFRRLV